MRTIACILILVLLVSGCATGRYQPSGTVSEADRKVCEEFAQAEVARRGQSPAAAYAKTAGVSVLVAALLFIPTLGVSSFVAPVGLFLEGPSNARKVAKENRATYERAMETCLEPGSRAQTLGPDHPDVATSLTSLASRYVAQGDYAKADPLYRRALAIRDRALGPEHPEVATTLEGYAAVLRKTDRATEAEEMEARARAIRAKDEQPSRADAKPVEPSGREVGPSQ